MGLYKNTNGVLTPIAGRGKAEYGASTIRSGSVTITTPANNYKKESVIFNSPMPDSDYEVDISMTSDFKSHKSIVVSNKTANGFDLIVTNSWGGQDIITLIYTAFKLYTDNEYNNILASMPSNASANNKLMAKDEFVVVIANLRNESLPAGIGELYKDIPVPTGYSPFCIVDYDLGRLQGLNITGISLAATIGQVRIATYCDRAITNELNGSIRVMCRKN